MKWRVCCLCWRHLLPPKRIFTNLRARAGHPFQLLKYTTLLHKKSFIVRVLHKHVVLFGHWLIGFCVWLWFYFKRCFPFVCAFVTWIKITYLLTYLVYVRVSLCDRRALKGGFMLVPLFGLQLLLTIYRPDVAVHGARHYEYVTIAITNSQVRLTGYLQRYKL